MSVTLTLTLGEATDEQLRRELSRARTSAAICERQGQRLHTWTTRADAIQAELDRRIRTPNSQPSTDE